MKETFTYSAIPDPTTICKQCKSWLEALLIKSRRHIIYSAGYCTG